MSFLVPKKWKNTWSKSVGKSFGSSTEEGHTATPLDESDFLNIMAGEMNTSLNKEEIANHSPETKPTVSTPNLPPPSIKKKPLAKDYQECPICGTVLLDIGAMAAMAHVDECLTHAVAKGDPRNKRITKPPKPNNNNMPPTLNFQSNPFQVPTLNLPYQPSPVPLPKLPLSSPQPSSPTFSKPPHSDSPFAVICPYEGCGLQMEAADFFHHAIMSHATGNQAHSCPICILSGNVYKPKKNTHLYQHLKRQHTEFAQIPPFFALPQEEPTQEPDQSPEMGENFVLPTKFGSRYIVDTIQEEDEKECTICFEEFHRGEYIARLDCFCVFHKDCLETWYRRMRKCPLHKE